MTSFPVFGNETSHSAAAFQTATAFSTAAPQRRRNRPAGGGHPPKVQPMPNLPTILKTAFALVAVTGIGAADFAARSAARGRDYGPAAYAADLPHRLALAVHRLRPVDPAGFLPPAPEGWAARDTTPQDLARIAAAPQVPPDLFESGEASGDTQATRTYTAGASLLALRITLRDSSDGADATGPLFATVAGLPFRQVAAQDGRRTLAARLGGRIAVDVATRAEPDQILHVLSGLDVVGLNSLLADPLPGLGQGGAVPGPAMTGLAPAARVSLLALAAQWLGPSATGDPPPALAAPAQTFTCTITGGRKRCRLGG